MVETIFDAALTMSLKHLLKDIITGEAEDAPAQLEAWLTEASTIAGLSLASRLIVEELQRGNKRTGASDEALIQDH